MLNKTVFLLSWAAGFNFCPLILALPAFSPTSLAQILLWLWKQNSKTMAFLSTLLLLHMLPPLQNSYCFWEAKTSFWDSCCRTGFATPGAVTCTHWAPCELLKEGTTENLTGLVGRSGIVAQAINLSCKPLTLAPGLPRLFLSHTDMYLLSEKFSPSDLNTCWDWKRTDSRQWPS